MKTAEDITYHSGHELHMDKYKHHSRSVGQETRMISSLLLRPQGYLHCLHYKHHLSTQGYMYTLDMNNNNNLFTSIAPFNIYMSKSALQLVSSTHPTPGEDIHHTVISCVGN